MTTRQQTWPLTLVRAPQLDRLATHAPARRPALWDALWHMLLTWQRRAHDRDTLNHLDAHQLRDIGLTRADVNREASKPFWRA